MFFTAVTFYVKLSHYWWKSYFFSEVPENQILFNLALIYIQGISFNLQLSQKFKLQIFNIMLKLILE